MINYQQFFCASTAAETTLKDDFKELYLRWIDGIKQANTNTQKQRKVYP